MTVLAAQTRKPWSPPSPASSPSVSLLRRCGGKTCAAGTCSHHEDETTALNRAGLGPAPGLAPPIVGSVLSSPGRALDPSLRAPMERHFGGHDFSRVRVHSDARAAESAAAVGARAYAVGRHVVFGAGEYAPSTTPGRQLLAHELTHVVQQGDQPIGSTIVVDDDPALEREASESALGARASRSEGGGPPFVARLRRQPAPNLAPQPPPAPVRPPPNLRVIEGGLSRAPAQTAGRATWRHFWRAVVRRFGIRGAAAAGLSLADGPLPIGELISLGLAIWTIAEIVYYWDEIWAAASQLATEVGDQAAPAPVVGPAPQAQPAPRQEEDRRRRCQETNPGAGVCDGFSDVYEAVQDFLMNEGYNFNALGDCRQVGTFGPGAIDACSGAPGIRWHCSVSGTSDEVSVFGCLCCNPDGTTGFDWNGPHWSDYMGRRGTHR
jgi:hypothetical protein